MVTLFITVRTMEKLKAGICLLTMVSGILSELFSRFLRLCILS